MVNQVNKIAREITRGKKMAWCVAPGCHNSSANSSVSFHALPDKKKNPSKYNAWYAAIGREILPARGKLCSDHFTPDCMELSPLMKLSVGADLYKGKTKMKLKQDAIPTIFYHKDAPKIRQSSINRKNRKNQEQVILFPMTTIPAIFAESTQSKMGGGRDTLDFSLLAKLFYLKLN